MSLIRRGLASPYHKRNPDPDPHANTITPTPLAFLALKYTKGVLEVALNRPKQVRVRVMLRVMLRIMLRVRFRVRVRVTLSMTLTLTLTLAERYEWPILA
jgi:hypothetical protein